MIQSSRVLIVDDEIAIRFSLTEVLRNEGYNVTAVESGEAALQQIEKQEFDLVLLDLRMKGIGGIEVLNSLRSLHPDTCVIVLTAHASLETAVEALRQGAHDYLFKPCKTDQLRRSVRKGLEKRMRSQRRERVLSDLERRLSSTLAELRDVSEQTAPPNNARSSATPSTQTEERADVLQCGDVTINRVRHTVEIDGDHVELTPTEFELLTYLAEEAPRVIPPRELIREVQGYDCLPWEAQNLVRSHIYNIRKKLREQTEKGNVIRTVRGAGYGLESP